MARRRKKPTHHEEEENGERWLLTYADMITLLMVLFIVLFAIGQIDQKKFEKLHDGLAQSFGESTVLNGGAGLLDGSAEQAPAPDDSLAGQQALQAQREALLAAQLAADATMKKAQEMAALEASFSTALAKKGLRSSVEFQRVQDRGLVVNIVTDRVLFDAGEASLRPEGSKVLDAMAPLLKKLPNGLVIEGHTDDQPMSDPRFDSNWELSTARATTVLRHLLGEGVAPTKVAAAGYSDQRPLQPGRSAASRARNRRVAIVILSTPTTPTTPSPTSVANLASIPGA